MKKTEQALTKLDDIRKYVELNGPKRVRNPLYVGRIVDLLTFNFSGPHEPKYFEKVSARIQEVLPKEDLVQISGERGRVVYFDSSNNSYFEALLDPKKVCIVPSETSFDLNRFGRVGFEQFFCEEYYQGTSHFKDLITFGVSNDFSYSASADFLAKALDFVDCPVLEVSQLLQLPRLSFYRGFSIIKYDYLNK